jgi:dTDP-4-dehydrorhamnose reductase
LDYLTQIEAGDFVAVEVATMRHQIELIINATALKAAGSEQQIMELFRVNSVIPRRLGQLAQKLGIRLLHFSTDSVYGSIGGPFRETDIPKPDDLYSMSKLLGEPDGCCSLTLRLSLIGRAVSGGSGLIDWFLAQNGEIGGYTNVLFSGLPVNEVARIIAERLLPNLNELHGVFNLSAASISKFDLLDLVGQELKLKNIKLMRNDSVKMNRSLNSARLSKWIGYAAPAWTQLIHDMCEFYERLERNGAIE